MPHHSIHQCTFCKKPLKRSKDTVSGTYFCGYSCRQSYYESLRPRLMCEHCGQEHSSPPSRQGRGERFCSRLCYEEHRKSELVTKVCQVCGKEFTVKAIYADRYKVCSRPCRTARTKYVACERCGVTFRAEPNLNRHYCSDECRNPPHYRSCPNCGITFRTEPKSRRRFCSHLCARRFCGETTLEEKVRSALETLGVAYYPQVPVGSYWVDFLIPDRRIALEADGVYWHDRTRERDARKTAFLESCGWCVVRITDRELKSSPFAEQVVRERITIPLLMPG